ncbi:MAG: peptidylprolyl isomerase, partial [Pseudomonadales bacterium]|nr:peptidylprolyl isomerase [Pseudomonadales bacterium]
LVYLHGTGALIPGLESELEGKSTGDKLQVSVAPADAYGEANPDLIQEVPREVFQGIENVEVGMQFQTDTQSGPRIITVSKVDGDVITIDGNHPLAGEQLHFSVEIESVREATEEEISHGHAH